MSRTDGISPVWTNGESKGQSWGKLGYNQQPISQQIARYSTLVIRQGPDTKAWQITELNGKIRVVILTTYI